MYQFQEQSLHDQISRDQISQSFQTHQPGDQSQSSGPAYQTHRVVHPMMSLHATLAQLVEHLTCNEDVVGSIPTGGSILKNILGHVMYIT